MADIFYANKVDMASTISGADEDKGDILLIFQCVGPHPPAAPGDPPPPDQPITLGQLVVGMTFANGYALARMLQQQLELPDLGTGYRGPVISRHPGSFSR